MSSIREARPADAAALLALKRALDGETRFMLLEPGERTSSEADERSRLGAVCARENSVVLVAEDDGALVGYVEATGGAYLRNRHAAYVVIGVRATHAGRGIGTRLLTALDDWATAAGIHRLELTVMTHNAAAIALYRKVGYDIEGTRRSSLLVDAELVDELWMAKLLGPTELAEAERPAGDR